MKNKSVEYQMREILEEYMDNVEAVMSSAMNRIPTRTAETLRNTSPKKEGKYAKGWKVKRTGKLSAVVYNATKPQITHLLENGHIIRNKFGEYGRAPAHRHIEYAADEGAQQFIEEIEKEL